jgi:hypothetical protein
MDYRVLDVESHSLKVEQHMKRVADGTYRLPEFQRTFVWDDERILKLWDSLYYGFPIGQLMLWEPNAIEFPMRSLGRRQGEIDTNKRTMAIIDGQQRLTAVYLVLSGAVPLRFDLEQERFVYGEGPNRLALDVLRDPNGAAIPLSEAAAQQFFFMRASAEEKDAHARVINRLNGVLTQRELPSQVIKDADYATVIGVFKRLNQQGEPLNQAQLTMAGISQHWHGVFRRTYDLLKRMNVEMGFDQQDDPSFVFRVWAGVHTGQHLVKHLAPEDGRSRYRKLAVGELYERSWTECERGIAELIELMRKDLDLTNFRFIRAHYPLAIAAHYFATHPDPSAEERESLKRWVVLALVSGRNHERAESKYAADIRATAKDRELPNLFRHRHALDPAAIDSGHLAVDKLAASSMRSAYATLLYLVARRLRATDVVRLNVRVGDELQDGLWQFHHVFSYASFDGERRRLQEALEDAHADGDEEKAIRIERHMESLEARVHSLGNLMFVHPLTRQALEGRPAAEYLAEIATTPEGRAALEAQLISLDPALWKHAAFDTFVRRRCEALAVKARELFFAPARPR